jgi:hypothetical protein
VLRAAAIRGFFGSVTAVPSNQATVDGSTSSTASRYGPASRRTSRSADSQGTTRRPNSRKMRWSRRTSQPTPLPWDRQRHESSEWFQPGRPRGLTRVRIVVRQYQESEGGGSALVLRLDRFVPVFARRRTERSRRLVQMTPRPARTAKSSTGLVPLPKRNEQAQWSLQQARSDSPSPWRGRRDPVG